MTKNRLYSYGIIFNNGTSWNGSGTWQIEEEREGDELKRCMKGLLERANKLGTENQSKDVRVRLMFVRVFNDRMDNIGRSFTIDYGRSQNESILKGSELL